jgi:hypothetical protein
MASKYGNACHKRDNCSQLAAAGATSRSSATTDPMAAPTPAAMVIEREKRRHAAMRRRAQGTLATTAPLGPFEYRTPAAKSLERQQQHIDAAPFGACE